MITESYSFLKKILGRDIYNKIKEYANRYIIIATSILIALLVLSLLVHYSFISRILRLLIGFSPIFIGYILGLIVWLDKGIDVTLQENYENYSFNEKELKGFNKTRVSGITLIFLGVIAILLSNTYKKQYTFECETFLVDHSKGIYHLNWDNNCKVAAQSSILEKMKGYQIDKSYYFCNWCEDWAYDAETEYNSNRFYRK